MNRRTSLISPARCWQCILMAMLIALAWSAPLHAQRVSLDSVRMNDTTVVHTITLTDGSRIVGRIQRVTVDSVTITSSVAITSVARSTVREVTESPSTALRNGALWFENPHPTRLIFGPTAIPLRRGEGYFADFWIFFASAAVGVTDRFTIGGGSTIIPGLDIEKNIFYLIPKVTIVKLPKFNLAVGALAAHIGLGGGDELAGVNDSRSLGVLYAVATAGSRESSLSFGTGFGYAGDRLAKRPIFTIAGQHRVGRRAALISENWVLPFDGDGNGVFSYGVRILGEKVAIDLALANVTGGFIFPGIPLVGVAIKF